MSSEKERYLEVARTVFEKTLEKGSLLTRCRVWVSSLHGDEYVSGDVGVLRFGVVTPVSTKADAEWAQGLLLYYSFGTNYSRDNGVVVGEHMLWSFLVTPESVAEGISEALVRWNACDSSDTHQLRGEERFFAKITIVSEQDRGDAVNLHPIEPAHPIILPYLTQSLGHLYGKRENYETELNHKHGGQWVGGHFQSFVRAYGSMISQAQRALRIQTIGRQ